MMTICIRANTNFLQYALPHWFSFPSRLMDFTFFTWPLHFFFLPFGFPSLSSIIVKKKAQKDNNGSCFCELRFTAGQKRAVERWNFCVKARSVWGDTGVYNPRPGGSPHVCLCAPLIHLQPGSPSSPIPPSLPLFMHPTPPPPPLLTHTCKRTLCPHRIQSCSPSSLAAPTAPRRHLRMGVELTPRSPKWCCFVV